MNANTQAVAPNVWEGSVIPSTLPPFITVGTQGAGTSSETMFLDAKGNQLVTRVPVNLFMGKGNFIVRLFGRVSTAGAYTCALKIYGACPNVQSTPVYPWVFTAGASGTAYGPICSSGAISLSTVTGNFMIEAELNFDITSGTLSGKFSGEVNDTLVSLAATTQLTGISTVTGLPGAVTYPYTDYELDFSASYTFNTGNASNYVIIDGLEVETY